MNRNKKDVKKAVAKAAGNIMITVADIFSTLPCDGPWYEVKVPKKLQK